ncbi:non-ribosomal peptide synthetase [Streptomyces sp. GbtcB6]|uniref:non-ribosomal peptide synthetase n=1 Tax=Streptomyces sp. GbtcB6 TaxID=2824751 RepID=UPI001C2FD073|nr:non-ribosomal peptide synthetase [Streptomyces sp. GbtcB6]
MSSDGIPYAFEAAVRRHSGRPAVRCAGRTLSYAELDGLTGALAAGIAPGQDVAVSGRDRLDHVVGLLAVLRAGGTHLPADADAPAERTEFIVRDAGATAFLTHGELTHGELTHGELTAGAPAPGPAGGSGYLVHTSGTTGRPKGVHVAASVLARHIEAATARFGITHQDVVLHMARPSVDVAVEQVLTALTTGACLVVPERGLLAAGELLTLLAAEEATVANLSAGYFQEVVAALRAGARVPGSLRLMISGSDRLYPETAAAWTELTGVPLLNAYGPTETTVTATVQDVHGLTDPADGERRVPIGDALGDRALYVLDDALRPVPDGTAGELHVGGPLLASGYWGRPAATAERFVADPFSAVPGARMYRTGDLVRRTAGERAPGALEFVGRTDHQVKIRGFRVEPGEVEQALATHPSVAACVVTAHEGRLAAYATTTALVPPEYREVRAFLADRLPEHMVPGSLTVLDAFPLTAGGKIDRTALPHPGAEEGPVRDGYVAPRTEAERLLAGVWSDVLGVPDVGAHDNFFHLGGDSLTAVRVVGRVADVFGVVSPYAIFEAPTLAEFAAVATAPEGERLPALTRSGRSEAPLSAYQRGLWFLDQWNPGSATYNVPWVFRFAADPDLGLLRRALETVVARHDSLRTCFVLGDTGPRQVVRESVTVPFTVTEAPRERTGELIAAAAVEPFDLETGPLLRAHALRVPDGGTVLLLVMHHIVWDEGSLSVLETELKEVYEALRVGRPHRLPELDAQYADYSAWQYDDAVAAATDAQLAYWAEQLADVPQTTALPTDRPRPELQAFRGAHHSFTMPDAVARAVRELAREEDATPFMVLLAALATTLHRRSGERDMVIGSPVNVRGRAGAAGLIGYFVNLLPLRLRIDPDLPFRDLVRHVRDVLVGAYRNQDASFDAIVDRTVTDPPRDRNPLCQVLLELHPLDTRPLEVDGITVTRELHMQGVSRFDLSVSVDDLGTGFTGRFEYDSDLFDAQTMEALCDSWLGALAAAVAAPAHTLFEAAAARTPDVTALISGDEELTYGQLNARANRLAHHLAGRGAGRGTVVAVLVERGFDLVVALLAALKTGAGYTLLDPDFPAERLAGAAADSGAGHLITHRGKEVPFAWQGAHIDLDTVAGELARHPEHDLGLSVTGDDLACVMFTSGSTGRPKGVAVPHRALTGTYAGQDYARFGPDEVWLQCSPVSWDAFALELYGALMFGGTCVLQTGQRPDPETVAELTRRHGVTQLQLSASLFNFLLEEFPDTFAGLGTAFTAGERASVTHVAKALEMFPGLRVANGYGPVESLGLTTCHTVVPEDVTTASIPIGRPLYGKDVLVLDEALRPVEPGVTGELYTAGCGLALGYTGRPGLTATRFVADPGGYGRRLYRTGDLGRRTADGTLEITGRADDQIKIRGFRVEPGEIEDLLTRHPGVREAAVTVYEPAPGDRRLAAYVTTVTDGSATADPDALLRYLAGRLPEYMVPATLDVLDALPLNANGKADRRALPVPAAATGGDGGGEAALVGRERLVADVMREILGLDEVGRHDSFFRIGGNSLSAVRVAMRLSRETGTRVPPHLVFRARTVSAIAELLPA